jgi:hypothetical protein
MNRSKLISAIEASKNSEAQVHGKTALFYLDSGWGELASETVALAAKFDARFAPLAK